MNSIPSAPRSVDELEDHLSEPDSAVIDLLARLDSDIVFLGVGGKMGPTMARMAQRAMLAAGLQRRVIGVSRFRSEDTRQKLTAWGIETHACDLLDAAAVAQLPDAPLVVSMSGFKFGATENPSYSWAMNCFLPGILCQRYRDSRIVAFSTGNVYGPVPRHLADGNQNHGSRESDKLVADGEYAMTAIGRERMYEHFSRTLNIPLAIVRLNYATELRYGVLVDLAQQVATGQPVDVSMAQVNVLWLGDANRMTLRALEHCSSPPRVINMAGDEILSIRATAQSFGQLLGKSPHFRGEEKDRALLNDGRDGYQFLGRPLVSAEQMLAWTADWVARGGENLGKPTHFQTTDGKF
jgi:nucleoside-diphosphate-sugar epimerase